LFCGSSTHFLPCIRFLSTLPQDPMIMRAQYTHLMLSKSNLGQLRQLVAARQGPKLKAFLYVTVVGHFILIFIEFSRRVLTESPNQLKLIVRHILLPARLISSAHYSLMTSIPFIIRGLVYIPTFNTYRTHSKYKILSLSVDFQVRRAAFTVTREREKINLYRIYLRK